MLLDNQGLKKKACVTKPPKTSSFLSSDRPTQTTVSTEMPTVVIAFFSRINFLAIVQTAEQSFNQSFSCGLLRNSFFLPGLG